MLHVGDYRFVRMIQRMYSGLTLESHETERGVVPILSSVLHYCRDPKVWQDFIAYGVLWSGTRRGISIAVANLVRVGCTSLRVRV
jgi:hypothetical protein